jgi:hypothetical protein
MILLTLGVLAVTLIAGAVEEERQAMLYRDCGKADIR